MLKGLLNIQVVQLVKAMWALLKNHLWQTKAVLVIKEF